MRKLPRFVPSALATVLVAGAMFAGVATHASAAVTSQLLIATGAGPGGSPHVRLYKADGTPTNTSFYAYSVNFTGGVDVAMGDLDGDGQPEIVTGPGAGGGPRVSVFDIYGHPIEKWAFFAYVNFGGGVHVAVGDLDGDGKDEIITGAGAGGGPHVRTWRIENDKPVMKNETFAYVDSFRGGVNVAVLNTGVASRQIITGAGPGGGPHVRVFSPSLVPTATSFFAYADNMSSGVSVAGANLGTTNDEIVTSAMGYAGHIRSFKANGTAGLLGTPGFNPFPNPGSTGAVIASFNHLDNPIIAGAAMAGSAVAQFAKTGLQASTAIFPYGNGWQGGVRVAGGFGKFDDTVGNPPTTTTSTSTTSTSTTSTTVPTSTTSSSVPASTTSSSSTSTSSTSTSTSSSTTSSSTTSTTAMI